MANRRMFSKQIIDSDHFLDMPSSAQSLYFHLAMRSDDDGICNSPKKIKSMVGASDDDLKLLIAKQFIIPFESGICVITHWHIHNYLRSDRYKETVYTAEKALLAIKDNGTYTTDFSLGIPSGNQRLTQNSIGKGRVGKNSIGKGSASKPAISKHIHFAPPSIEEVTNYCRERGNQLDAQTFVDFYSSKGWRVGNQPMKDWKACIRTWEKRCNTQPQQKMSTKQYFNPFPSMVFDEMGKGK